MAGTLWGADVEQLRTLAQQFSKTADLLQQQSTQLSSQINNNPAWKGADAQRFRSDWNSKHHTLLQQTVSRLKQESKLLLKNADEQEKASTDGSGTNGGPVGPLGHGAGPWAVAGGILAGSAGLLKNFMGVQKNIKGPLTLAKTVGQYGWVLKNQREDVVKALFTKGRHRLGGPGFEVRNLWQTTAGNKTLEGLLKDSSKASRTLNAIDKASDAASLKNLNNFIKPLDKLGGFVAEKPWLGKGTSLEWLGKSGIARGLGWAGVGFNTYDSVTKFADGDIKGGAFSAGKAALGVGCFLPPPAGTVCQVASVGIAVYENWDTITSVGKDIGEGVVNAVKDPGKFVSDTADNVKNAGKSVAKFFGFGN